MAFINISVKKHKITPQDVDARNEPSESKAPIYNKGRHSFEWREVGAVGAGGDMRKATYDRTDTSVVDNAETLDGNTLTQVRDHAPLQHHNDVHLNSLLATCDKYTKELMDTLGADVVTLEEQDLSGVRNHAPLTHSNSYHDGTFITTCNKYTKTYMDLLGINAATLGGKALGVGVGDIAFYDANGRVADVTKVKGTTVDATDIGAGKLLAYDATTETLVYKTLAELVPALNTDGKLILTGSDQMGTKTDDLAELWNKTTKLVTGDFEATEFDLPNKIPTLDASTFLALSQVVGNVPGLDAAGNLVLTAISTKVNDLDTLWTKTTKLVTSDFNDATFNVANGLAKLDGSTKVPYAQVPRIGGAATLVVAAVDSQDLNKADYPCNGTDDQDTIDTAIGALPTSGGTVVLLEGNYKLSDHITIAANNITLKEQGKSTKLYLANGIQSNLIEVTGVSGILIKELFIDGTTSAADAGVNWNQCGIVFNNVDESKIRNCWIQANKRSGILLYNGSAQNDVIGCLSEGNTFYGILLLTTTSYNTIKGNTCTSNGLEGVLISTASANNSIIENICNNNTSSGIFIHSTSNNNTVEKNTCNNNGDDGIELNTNVYYNSIKDNTCVANGQHGVALYSTSSYNTVTGNTCVQNTSNGIHIKTSIGNAMQGNIVNNNTLRGILLDTNCTSNTISGNTCEGNTKEGIKLFSSSDDNTISGNLCYGNGDTSNTVNSILLDTNSNNNTISGNTCNKNAQDGIGIVSSSYNTITSNACRGNTRHGVYLTLCTGNTISSCICIGNQTDDIHLVSDVDYNNIQTNTCRAGTTDGQPNYGINISTLSCDSNMVTNNDLFNDFFASGSFNNAAPSTVTTAGNRTA